MSEPVTSSLHSIYKEEGAQPPAALKSSVLSPKWAYIAGAGAAVVSIALYLNTVSTGSINAITNSPQKMETTPANLTAAGVVVAMVNGQPIYEEELGQMLQQMPKAVAIDNYVNKVLAAQANTQGSSAQQQAAERRIQMASREIHSGVYFETSAKEIEGAVTEAEINDFYAKNISDSLFTKYDASYALYADPESAKEARSALSDKGGEAYKGAAKSFKKFEDPNAKGALFTVQQFPYDLGRVVEQLKIGDYSQPLPTRNGYFILTLNEKVAGKKPEVKDVKAQIVQALVQQRISEKITSLRGKARIELK